MHKPLIPISAKNMVEQNDSTSRTSLTKNNNFRNTAVGQSWKSLDNIIRL